ncbi:TPA: hypothetical protein RQN23_000819 [Aeromonas veronii]|nr:hypothetical protein [Aeromonas veronii]
MEISVSVQAAEKALQWCATHPGWKRICDVDDIAALDKVWSELSPAQQAPWIKAYPSDPQGAWEELADGKCKYRSGFITCTGKFYRSIFAVPPEQGLMQVFKLN